VRSSGRGAVPLRDQRGGHRDLSDAGIALGWADDELTVLELGHLLDDVDRRVEQVEVAAGERAQLAEAKSGERRREHQRAVARLDHIGDGVDLLDSGDGTLLGALDAGASDGAWVLGDQLVFDRGGEDAAEQSVGLRRRRRARSRSLQEAGVPGADRRRPEVAQRRVAGVGSTWSRSRPS
jgi:hypothetical protein